MAQTPNAVILAAGKSSKFFAPLYDKPKGLFEFRGEVLIERQIRQLKEAGIEDITVVVGYEKERFFYLEEWGVRLLVSMRYNDEMSLSSLDVARAYIGNTIICCADHWYDANPFEGVGGERSLRLVSPMEDARQEFVVDEEADGRLYHLQSGAPAGLAMVGYAFFTEDFAERFFALMDEDRSMIGFKALHWEQFWGRHCDELPLYGVEAPAGFREFDSLGDFARLDASVLNNVSQAAIANICAILDCPRDAIEDIDPLNKGLTNVSFSFVVGDNKYVYRHPGASSGNLVYRDAEVVAQQAAVDLGIDPSVIAIDVSGWKLSRFIEATGPFSYDDPAVLAKGIAQIRQFHESGVTCDYAMDFLEEGDRLQALAAAKKEDLARRYQALHDQTVRLWHHVALEAIPPVLCHNDTYAVNWIVADDELCLIDWEYAGMNDPFADLATLTVRDGLSREQNDQILALYLGREPSFEEKRRDYAINALCGWYWFNWALYKDTLGEDGFFMLPSWRAMMDYGPLALAMYEDPAALEAFQAVEEEGIQEDCL